MSAIRLVARRGAAPVADLGWWYAPDTESRSEDAAGGRAPYLATMLLLTIVIVAPQERLPALAPLRIALLTAVLAVVAHVYDRFKRKAGLVAMPPQLGIVALLLAWAVATLPLSLWAGGSVDFLLDIYLKTIVVFWLLGATADTWQRTLGAARVMVLMAIPLAVTAVWNFASGVTWEVASGDRIVGYEGGLSRNPNDLALVLNLLIPIAVALHRQARHASARLLFLGVVALFVGGVVATFSRGGFVTLAVVFVIYLTSFMRRGLWRPVLVSLVLAALTALCFPAGYSSRLATITSIEADPTGSAQARWTDTVEAVRQISEKPIVGSGIGMNVLALDKRRGETGKNVHNVYLQYAVELGLPGLALFLWLYWSCLRAMARVAGAQDLASQSAGMPALGQGLLVSLLAFGVAALFHPVAYQFYFYLIAGLAVAVGNLGRQGVARSQAPRVDDPRSAELWWRAEPGRAR